LGQESIDRLYQTLEFDRVLKDLAQRANCPLSAERLRQLRPLPDVDSVRTSLARITELRTFMDSGGTFPIAGFADIRQHLRTASVERSYLDPGAFREIATVLEQTGAIRTFLKKNRSNLPLLYRAAAGLSPQPDLHRRIAGTIDLRSLDIKDQASPRLSAIRRQMARAREGVRRHMEALLNRLWRKGVLQERLVTVREGRWVLPVKETHRHLIEGVLHDESASGATVFVEPLETLELNNKIRRLQLEERHEIEKVLRTLTALVRKQMPALEQNFEILVFLDCIHAMALASRVFNGHEPAINRDGILEIKNGRHPLLLLKRRDSSDVIPLNLSIGKGFNTLVITGPNAGGKTVALKTVGLLALMASCGLHIPADADSEIPIFKDIFAHVGDKQSIEMDLSTFSAHLDGIKTVLEKASSGSLVLIDEIGTGTDPQEGAAIAISVMEALNARGAVTLVTTHQGAIKAFAHETPGIANGSMAFDSQTLTPTYRFRPDLPGSSYALEIAGRMGLPEAILKRARALIGSQANRLDGLILSIEQQIEENRQLERELRAAKSVVDRLKSEYEEKNARLVQEAKKFRRKAAEEASAIVMQANAAVEKAVRTIREKGAAKEAIREAKRLIEEEKDAVRKELEATQAGQAVQKDEVEGQIRPGDRVFWRQVGTAGTVLSNTDPDGLLVVFGDLKVHVPEAELGRMKEVGKSLPDRVPRIEVSVPVRAQEEVDIRGMRVEEALSVVDKFLDDALLAGLKEVRIIHGVGTGALRRGLTPFLNRHPVVQAIRSGGLQGENPGVTIVEITGG